MLDRFVNVTLDGHSVRINVLQPIALECVYNKKYHVAETKASSLPKKSKEDNSLANLPKVNFRRLPSKVPPNSKFHYQQAYIKYKPQLNEELDDCLEYDMDEEDDEWLKLINQELKEAGENALDAHSFEMAMDRLEKESFFQCSKSGSFYKHSVDQDAVCCVCNDGDGSNINQIIFCDMCNIAVHQDCYGVPYVPEGQWLCRRCQMSPSKPVSCVLCPSSHGAFKQTVDNRWAHVVCALWLSEVHFANSVFMEPIDGIENSLRRRCKLRCIVCKQKMGACLQCSKKSCTRSFHMTCANAAGMEMRAEIVDNPKREGGTEVKYTAFCHYHSANFIKHANFDTSKHRKKVDEMMKKAREKLAASRAVIPPVSIPTVPPEKLESICERANISDVKMRHIVSYWSLKRKARFGVPLLRRLIHCKPHTRSAESSFNQKDVENHDDEMASYCSVRSDLERVRLLCELVKKREKMKKEYYNTMAELIGRITKPLATLMMEILDKIAGKDYSNVFAKPVSEKDVPGYSSIIKRPMDLSTMRKKVTRGGYRQLVHLKADFTLMMNNCATFNRHNEFFWKYGHRLHRIGLKYFKAAEAELENTQLDSVGDLPTTVIMTETSEADSVESELDNSHVFTQPSSFSSQKTISSPSSRKRSTRCSEETTASKVLKISPEDALFNTFRENSLCSPRMIHTDYSSTQEESSSAGEDAYSTAASERGRRKKRLTQRLNHVIEKIPIDCDFEHGDIVWVAMKDTRRVGRVIDLRMRVLLDGYPIDEMLSSRPKEPHKYLLIKFFDKQETWVWTPIKNISHCILRNTSDGSLETQDELRRAKEFL